MSDFHIVLASDQRYVQHAGVTITSLLENSASCRQFTVNFIDGGVSEESLSSLEAIVSRYYAKFKVHTIANEFDNLYVSRHITKAAYYRLAIPDILPQNVEKAIYLDTDIIVRHDLKELWETDIANSHIGAVLDIGIDKQKPDLMAKLGLPVTAPYFNSGVLLINTLKWRDDQIREKVMFFLNKNKELPYHDQDALNGVLSGSWTQLNPKWNVYKGIFHKYYKLNREKLLPSKFIEAANDPYIVHFTGKVKPWHYACGMPYADEYYKYLALTPWKNYRPIDNDIISFGKRFEWKFKRKIIDLLK